MDKKCTRRDGSVELLRQKKEKQRKNREEKTKMEVGMSLNALVRLPLSSSRSHEDVLLKHSLYSSRIATQKPPRQRQALVVEAKGKRGMQPRQFQRPPPPSLPKIEDDGNPRFVIFIRMANVSSTLLAAVIYTASSVSTISFIRQYFH